MTRIKSTATAHGRIDNGRRSVRGSGLQPPGYPRFPIAGSGLFKQAFSGENHIPLLTSAGLKLGNFEGPGTNVIPRVKRGDKGITYSDEVSKAHDLRYMLAQNTDDIRAADSKFINSLNVSGKDNIINKTLAKSAMKGKVWLEDKGLMSRDKFSGSLPNKMDESDRVMLQNELGKMEQTGLGSIKQDMLQLVSRKRNNSPEPMPPVVGRGVKSPSKMNRKQIEGFVVSIFKSWSDLHGTAKNADMLAKEVMSDMKGKGITAIKNHLAVMLADDLNDSARWVGFIRKDLNKLWTALRKGQSGSGLSGGNFWDSIKSGLSKVGQTIASGAKSVVKAAPEVGKFLWNNKEAIAEGVKTGIQLAGML